MGDTERIAMLEKKVADLTALLRGMVGRNGVRVQLTSTNIVIDYLPAASNTQSDLGYIPAVPRMGGSEWVLKAQNGVVAWVLPDTPAATASAPNFFSLVIDYATPDYTEEGQEVRFGGVVVNTTQGWNPVHLKLDLSDIVLKGAPTSTGTPVTIFSRLDGLMGVRTMPKWTATQVTTSGTPYKFTGGGGKTPQQSEPYGPAYFYPNGSFILK